MANVLRIEIVGMDNWIKGTSDFARLMDRRVQVKLLNALDATFQRTQELVHVITGSLKASGRKEITQTEQGVFQVEIVYGGPAPGYPNDPVDYAAFEWGRGGEHDFLTPAIVSTEEEYPKAMRDAVRETARALFGRAA